MLDQHAEKVGKITGGVSALVLGMVTWNSLIDTIVLTFIGSVIAGVTGFFVTMILQKYFKKSSDK